jgi:tRNA A37 methylthiotransferase MiaB
MGGKTYAVYNPENEKEFVQTCDLVERSRVHNNGPADYRKSSSTSIWMKQKTTEILRNMVKKRTDQLNQRTGLPPTHIQESQYESSNHPNRQETFWK